VVAAGQKGPFCRGVAAQIERGVWASCGFFLAAIYLKLGAK
jgi:hypothetical protein